MTKSTDKILADVLDALNEFGFETASEVLADAMHGEYERGRSNGYGEANREWQTAPRGSGW